MIQSEKKIYGLNVEWDTCESRVKRLVINGNNTSYLKPPDVEELSLQEAWIHTSCRIKSDDKNSTFGKRKIGHILSIDKENPPVVEYAVSEERGEEGTEKQKIMCGALVSLLTLIYTGGVDHPSKARVEVAVAVIINLQLVAASVHEQFPFMKFELREEDMKIVPLKNIKGPKNIFKQLSASMRGSDGSFNYYSYEMNNLKKRKKKRKRKRKRKVRGSNKKNKI